MTDIVSRYIANYASLWSINLFVFLMQIYLRVSHSIETYRRRLPNVPLPSEPILIQWGTQLKAAIFYARYVHIIKEVSVFSNVSVH